MNKEIIDDGTEKFINGKNNGKNMSSIFGCKLRSKRGQFAIMNIMIALVELILFAVLYTPMVDIVVVPNENVTGSVGILISLVPIFWWLLAIIVLFATMNGSNRQPGASGPLG